MTTQKKEPQFWDDFMDVVDGDPAAVEAYADLLAESTELRDARFEGEHAVGRLAEAGDDWNPPADLEDRLIAEIEHQAENPQGVMSEEAATPSSGPRLSAEREQEAERADAANIMPAAPPTRPTGTPKRGTVVWLFGAGAAVAAAALAGLAFLVGSLSGGDDQETPEASIALLTARVEQVTRAGAQGALGLEIRPADADGFVPATDGSQLLPGSTVRTDERTRAQIALSDGSVIVLNHTTEVVLSATSARELSLTSGELIAEVAHLEDGPRASFVVPTGRIEVLGTKFLLTSTGDVTSVRVVRGSVRAHPESGAAVTVKAGEEGLLEKGAPASVTPALNLASSIGWSELEGEPSAGESLRGIGELRARRPGESEDQERPLTVSSQKVEVRIVGSVARTEIEQSFQNDGPHTLEGIYRFPLPPDAQIASLSLEVDGEWMEGAFVSKDRGRRIWRGVIRNATPERQRREVEEFVWVPGPWRDPALLEWQRGGQFELRIFPIPARGARRIRLAYTQTVSPIGRGRRYVYPLPYSNDESTRVGRFQASVQVAGASPAAPPRAHGYEMSRTSEGTRSSLRFAADDFLPAGNLTVDFRLPNEEAEIRWWTYDGQATVAPGARSQEQEPDVAAAQRALHQDQRPYVVFALRPDLPAGGRTDARDYVLVLDSSQSMVGERWNRSAKLAGRIVGEMDRRDRFVVLACDATCERFAQAPMRPSAHASGQLGEWLESIRPAGASDLARAMTAGAEALGSAQQSDRAVHVIYIGDGMSSVGHRRPSSVAALVRPLASEAKLSFSTVGIGSDADGLMLRAVARAGGGHHIPYVPGQRLSATALAVLETTFGATLEDAALLMPEGVVAVAPAQLPAIRAGQEVLVVGRLTGDHVRGELTLTGRVGGAPFRNRYPVSLTATGSGGNAFVPSLWASRTIEELELSGKPADAPRIVALSKAYGVMSRHTSLLVLESEAMFRAFGVDRAQERVQWSGDEEMLTGESEGLNRASARMGSNIARLGGSNRSAIVARPRERELGSTFGSLRSGDAAGGSGASRSGPRTGAVVGGRSRRRGIARTGSAQVTGTLPSEVIVRVMRRHMPRIRACYERELQRQPNIAGRLHVQFVISANGSVSTATARQSTLNSTRLEDCIVRGVRRMRFPQPSGGGSVTVSYPFIFNANGGVGSTSTARPSPRRLGGGRMMRREWFSVGSIHGGGDPTGADHRRIERTQEALRDNPDSRDRHRDLARALARAGEVERATEAVQQWIERDQLDPEALTLLSDLVGRKGDRRRAIRLLSGIVDLQPDDRVLQERLARAFERAGMRERACSHRVALAEIRNQDPEVVSRAVRCERALDRRDGAERLLQAVINDDDRERAAELASEQAPRERARGQLTLDATWEGPADVDLAIVTPQGTRISWLGGRRSVVGRDATTIGREQLGLRRASRGTYYVEVTRAEQHDQTPVEGTIAIRLLGERRTIPFHLDAGARRAVARLVVERRSRLVPQ